MVELSWRGRVAVLKLNRPERRNALCLELLAVLEARLSEVGEAHCLVLQGAGGVFSAGADLRERAGLSAEQRTLHTRRIAALCDSLEAMSMPVPGLTRRATLVWAPGRTEDPTSTLIVRTRVWPGLTVTGSITRVRPEIAGVTATPSSCAEPSR